MGKNTALIVAGILVGATASLAIGATSDPNVPRKVRHMKRNMSRARHIVSDAARDFGHMHW